MRAFHRDTIIAVFLLACCSILAWSSLSIRDPGYGTLSPAAWPRAVVAVLALFSLIYFFQSLKYGPRKDETSPERPPGLSGFFRHYRNPIACFAIYTLFMATLEWLGALIGGILLVFGLLSALGGFRPRDLLKHALFSVASMGLMWALFTFGLRVILPEGELFPVR